MPDYENILIGATPVEGLFHITFNRPSLRNALSTGMAEDLKDALERLRDSSVCRGLVLSGAGGRAFMAGADIAELKARGHRDAFTMANTRLFRQLEQFPHPTIAAIQGYALGGGCELAMACDLRVAGRRAVMGQPETALGILPGAGGCYRLPRLVGLGRAKELIVTGRLVEADEALRIGLVEQVVEDEDVIEAAYQLGASIVKNSDLAVRLAKVLLNSENEMSVPVAMALESTGQAVLYDDPEKHDRMGAFLRAREERRAARAKKEDI